MNTSSWKDLLDCIIPKKTFFFLQGKLNHKKLFTNYAGRICSESFLITKKQMASVLCAFLYNQETEGGPFLTNHLRQTGLKIAYRKGKGAARGRAKGGGSGDDKD